MDIFRFQSKQNPVYAEYLKHLKVAPSKIRQISQIPFLPISFFKKHKVLCNTEAHIEKTFTSSGTGGSGTSRHYLTDLSVYKKSFRKGFQLFFGKPDDYIVLALLPGYLERSGSSLVYMAEDLIKQSQSELSGFFLHDFPKLNKHIIKAQKTSKKILLLGVSFALLDFFKDYRFSNPEMIVMETGGMKGRRKEIVRNELHELLAKAAGTKKIYSEYGMTELLSQAYSLGNERFISPPWMQIRLRDLYDPFSEPETTLTGGLNVIDLANFNSCAFIETQDLGKRHTDGSFEVLGRFDHSDIRGCNLMAE
jgi:phenylacetate-coenzyme A ligase PaaK-like adenylate-forming protein